MSKLDDILASEVVFVNANGNHQPVPAAKQQIKDLMLELIDEPEGIDMFVDGVLAIDKNYLIEKVKAL